LSLRTHPLTCSSFIPQHLIPIDRNTRSMVHNILQVQHTPQNKVCMRHSVYNTRAQANTITHTCTHHASTHRCPQQILTLFQIPSSPAHTHSHTRTHTYTHTHTHTRKHAHTHTHTHTTQRCAHTILQNSRVCHTNYRHVA
jgi:hypothetical protein